MRATLTEELLGGATSGSRLCGLRRFPLGTVHEWKEQLLPLLLPSLHPSLPQEPFCERVRTLLGVLGTLVEESRNPS